MLEDLKQKVYDANMMLVFHKLVVFTWGNVSAKSDDGYVVIKPSGVEYDKLKPDDMVIVDMAGNIVEGRYKPSSDTDTHLELYRAFPKIGGVCHTHSTYATSFAQAGRELDAFGTTHADYFYGAVPCTRLLTKDEASHKYEQNTGKVIIERFENIDYEQIPSVLVRGHGVFSWGENAYKSVYNAVVVEEIAKMNYLTLTLNKEATTIPDYILDTHYNRKHGKNAYYGQK